MTWGVGVWGGRSVCFHEKGKVFELFAKFQLLQRMYLHVCACHGLVCSLGWEGEGGEQWDFITKWVAARYIAV